MMPDTKSDPITRQSGMQALIELRAQAKENGIQDLTLDEINEEISRSRYENHTR